MTDISKLRTGIFAALAVGGVVFATPALAADTCTGTLAQYSASVSQLQDFSAKAEAMADQNPIYIADVEYYASALAQAQHCVKQLGPVATASR